MQPHIFITGASEDPLSPSLHHNQPKSTTTALGPATSSTPGFPLHTSSIKSTNGRLPAMLSVPTWETMARRPSCLPNDTEINLRPKLRKLSSYDLSINDTLTSDSFDPNSVSTADSYDDIIDSEPPPCLESLTAWVLGDVQYITDFLDRWPLISFVLPLKLGNAILRTIGAPMLANNPFSGALILTAIILEAPMVALWALSALVVALVMALILKQPQHLVSSGQITQHGFLLGLLMGHATQHMPDLPLLSAAIILAICSALSQATIPTRRNLLAKSVLLGNALSSWLSQTNLPGLTLPYILIGVCLAHSVGYNNIYQAQVTSLYNTTYSFELQWTMVLQGAVRGAGQVYGCVSLQSSALVFSALLIFSPVAFAQACLGTLVGAFCDGSTSSSVAVTYDDICIRAPSANDMQIILNEFSQVSKDIGLVISATKTKYFSSISQEPRLVLSKQMVKVCENHKYLGIPVPSPPHTEYVKDLKDCNRDSDR
ncbi:hypothetical protein SK128_025456 [Halocaridina rubra]|uniref:Uncharacterized protein n=1 Tax=Halocaridina rubra TaxID=373956 RepID=A0AAN8XB24_HALRR